MTFPSPFFLFRIFALALVLKNPLPPLQCTADVLQSSFMVFIITSYGSFSTLVLNGTNDCGWPFFLDFGFLNFCVESWSLSPTFSTPPHHQLYIRLIFFAGRCFPLPPFLRCIGGHSPFFPQLHSDVLCAQFFLRTEIGLLCLRIVFGPLLSHARKWALTKNPLRPT